MALKNCLKENQKVFTEVCCRFELRINSISSVTKPIGILRMVVSFYISWLITPLGHHDQTIYCSAIKENWVLNKIPKFCNWMHYDHYGIKLPDHKLFLNMTAYN